MGEALADWHEARLKKSRLAHKDRAVTTTYGNKAEYVPLQIADVFANSLFATVENYTQTGMWEPKGFWGAITENKRSPVLYMVMDTKQKIKMDVKRRSKR